VQPRPHTPWRPRWSPPRPPTPVMPPRAHRVLDAAKVLIWTPLGARHTTCPSTSHKHARQGSLSHYVHRAQEATQPTIIHTKGAPRALHTALHDGHQLYGAGQQYRLRWARDFWVCTPPGGRRRGGVQAACVPTSHTSPQARPGDPGSVGPPHELIEWLCVSGASGHTHTAISNSVPRGSSKNTQCLTILVSCLPLEPDPARAGWARAGTY
jgi:hypothetical protein